MEEKKEKYEKINDIFTLNIKYSRSLKKWENLFQLFIVLKDFMTKFKKFKKFKFKNIFKK